MNFLETMRDILREEGLATQSERKRPDWSMAWQGVADIVRGITIADPRMPGIMAALEQCDAVFAQDDWSAFEQAVQLVRQACINPSPVI